MAKDTFHGPLEQVDACCWRIPKSYKPGMRVDGLIFANEKLIEQIKQGPGARAGGQRRLPARHPARQPGHARHPLGLRLLHRRRLRHRSGRGRRHLARRRRLRHQLRRPLVPHQPLLSRRQAASAQAGRGAVPARADRRRAGRASTRSTARSCSRLLGEGPSYLIDARPGDAGRPRAHRGQRPARRRRPGPGQRPRHGARRASSAARSARATTSSKCRSSITSSTRRPPRSWAWRRTWSAS